MAEPGARFVQVHKPWYRGDSSPSGAQRIAVSSSNLGVQSLICWADGLGKQTNSKGKASLSNGKAQATSRNKDSVDSLSRQAI